ncbi:putative leucine-rich repeat receptor-like protein kinase imk3 [Turnera subulata]|uniref:Leucine-rich repeat receptor-like protein kinase imk3 n=1 Tax=Turnera subulata TaxID=218843 RepID=A0A9Q0GI45_9ROSI|nr:putative leucine-rich repeat receptor-like protein kinase imk3 [Turnera subulata]
MEMLNKPINRIHKYPFQSLAHWWCTSDKKKEKWKVHLQPKMSLLLYLHIFLSFHLLLIYAIQPVSSQDWDGVVVTQADFQALQAFKQELLDPKGFLRSWNDSGYGACSGGWVGIKCAQGQVIVIQLPWKGLGGRITDKIGQLQALRKLSLHDNRIGGSIPQTMGLLPDLRGVQLFNNRFWGSIPPSLGLCLLLQNLDLGNNSLTGTIPDSLANSTKLFRLNLGYNSLSGPIPVSLTRSSSLIFLDFQSNNLSGSIPEAIGGLGNLSTLNLKRNQFSGPIPATIGNISTLTQLDLSENKLSGEIPDSLTSLTNLVSFYVSYNNLSGPVPTSLAQKFNSSSFVGNIQLCGYNGGAPCPPNVPPPPPPGEVQRKHHRKLSTKDVILIAAGALLIVLLIICFILCCCLIRKRTAAKKGKTDQGAAAAAAAAARGGKEAPAVAGEAAGAAGGEAGGKLVHFDGPMIFTADDLLCATAEIMGKSTYGTVYKATLEDGSQVAVKRLREKITRGQREFETEVNVLGKIRHPNLLAMRAYYLGPKGEKLLVFDYMPKGSLATFLHARGPDTPVNWPTRMRIAQGMTRGLFYLHNNENIIHGNLTSNNVLIDDQTNAKIGDYGLSRLMTAAANTNVIAAAGALGYRAPELSKLKKANTKTDVYSLGVIILELLTGKSPGEAMNGVDLPQWVASIVKEEWTNEVFDVELMKEAPAIGDELLNTLKLALHCVDPSPAARPEVQQVLQQLEEIRPEVGTSAGPSGGGDDGAMAPSSSE